jgi:hypothetical protein
MSEEAAWITQEVNAVKSTHPVPDSVSARMTELLKGQLSERQLTSTELTTVAGLLIMDMASPNQLSKEEKT